MTHLSDDMARARMNNPNHNGDASRVRTELARTNKPLSVYKLTMCTGLDADRVRRALSHLLQVGGIVSELGPKRVTYYKLWTPKAKASDPVAGDEYKIAGPITIPQYRYGGTRLG